MRNALSILIGCVAVYFVVICPARAKINALYALQSGLPTQSVLVLLLNTQTIDECNTGILDAIGKHAASIKQYGTSVWAYGKAMECQPDMASFRMKYGESLLGLGYPEIFAFQEAVKMEPHNPIYRDELERVTKFLSQLK